eukprot:6396979-Prymnesium_polylepis.1
MGTSAAYTAAEATGSAGMHPICLRPLVPPHTKDRVVAWLQHNRRDLHSIQAQLLQGVPPAQISRNRPLPLAVGTAELHPWARDRVWDCRRQCCE